MMTLLSLLFLASIAQESPEQLIERMARGRIDERQSAQAALLQLGPAALPALRKAAADPDREIAVRARGCLERIEIREKLTPALRSIEGLDLRLARGGPPAWTALFLEAASVDPKDSTTFGRLGRADLDVLVEPAFAGTTDEPQRMQILGAARRHKLASARRPAEAIVADPTSTCRPAAAAYLVATAGIEGLDRTAALLKNPNLDVRKAAIDTLEYEGIREAAPLLLGLREEADIALEVGCALLRLGRKEGLPVLLKLPGFQPDDRFGPPWKATLSISAYAGPEALPSMRPLLRFMQRDPNSADYALQIAANWGDRESLPAIEGAVREFRIWGNNGMFAVQALFAMGATSSLPTLLKLAEESAPGAAYAIGQMGLREAIPALRDLLAKGDASAAVPLALLGDVGSIPELRKGLDAKRYDDRRGAACTALALLNDVESAERIGSMREAGVARRIWPALKAMNDPDPAALPEAVGPIASWTDSEYRPQLGEGTNGSFRFNRYLSLRATATVRAGRSAEQLRAWLGLEGNEYPGLIAAAALARSGRAEGVEPLLRAGRPLFGLNAARRPEAWAKLERATTSLDLYGTCERIHRALAKEAGLALEGPPAGSDAHLAWTKVHERFRKWGRPATLAEAFEMIEDDRWSVVLEDDRLRILPREEALAFWRAWAKK